MTCFQSSEYQGDYRRVEVPLHIVPTDKINSACVQSLVGLPGILTMEEEEAYQKYTFSFLYSVHLKTQTILTMKLSYSEFVHTNRNRQYDRLDLYLSFYKCLAFINNKSLKTPLRVKM